MNNTCIICGKPKRSRFWLCKHCAVEYGAYNVPYKLWPKWVREFIRYARVIEARYKQFNDVCISFSQVTMEKIVNTDGEIVT